MDLNEAIEAAKAALEKQLNATEISIKSSNLKDGVWRINTSFILNNEQKYYSVSVNNSSGSVEDISETKEAKSGSGNAGGAPTLILVALILQIIVVVVYAVIFYMEATSAIAAAEFSDGFYAGMPSSAMSSSLSFTIDVIIAVFVIIFLILFLIDLFILLRINKIRSLMDKGDYKAAYDADSVGFGIVALLFGGIITGILVLVARGDLEAASR